MSYTSVDVATIGEAALAAPTVVPGPVIRVGGVLLWALLPISAALLARRNVRLGRSDRRGALRLAAMSFVWLTVS